MTHKNSTKPIKHRLGNGLSPLSVVPNGIKIVKEITLPLKEVHDIPLDANDAGKKSGHVFRITGPFGRCFDPTLMRRYISAQ